jgi:virginiamycin A acetyltransferase
MINLGTFSYVVDIPYNRFDVEVNVGNYTSIASGLCIIAGQHNQMVSTFTFHEHCGLDYPDFFFKGKIIIGNDVWIGMNVAIMEGVSIGDGAIIGACTVVTKDVEPFSIVVGNPMQKVMYRFSLPIIQSLQEIKWWYWGFEKIKERIQDFQNIKKFCTKYGK